MGELGAISADVTHAKSTLADDSTHSGQSIRFLYAKSLNGFGTNFQLLGYRYSTSGFYSLDETAYKQMRGYTGDHEDNDTEQQNPWMDITICTTPSEERFSSTSLSSLVMQVRSLSRAANRPTGIPMKKIRYSR